MLRRHWPFALAVVLQLGLLATIPGKKIWAQQFGAEISLKTRPVDPYDMLAGYYVTLAYEVERVPTSLRPSGVQYDSPVWLELAPGSPAWTLRAVHTEKNRPADGHVVIKALWKHGDADIPQASRLYIPEDQRQAVDRAVATSQTRPIVDLRVGPDGTPVVLRLHANGQTFGD